MTGPVISGASILGGRRELSRVSSSLLFAVLIHPGPSGPPATRPGLSFLDTVALWPPVTSHLSQWALVLEASFLSGVSLGGAAGSQLSTPPRQVLGSVLLHCRAASSPTAPLLPSSAPLCPVACGKVYSSDFQGALRRFTINAWLHHCLLWMR